MEERFVIKRKDFKKLERYAENIYNTAVVIDYFCSSQKEYEELYNLVPIVKNSRRDADQVNAFFYKLSWKHRWIIIPKFA